MRRVRSRPSSPVWRDSPHLSPQGSASSWFSPAGMQATPPRAQNVGILSVCVAVHRRRHKRRIETFDQLPPWHPTFSEVWPLRGSAAVQPRAG